MPQIKLKTTKTSKCEVDVHELATSITDTWEPQEIASFLMSIFDNIQYEYTEQVFVDRATDWGYDSRFKAWSEGKTS